MIMKRDSVLILIAVFLCVPGLFAQDWDPVLQGYIDQVNLDSLVHTVRILSGEDSVMICGKMYRIEDREFGSFGNELAAYYIKHKLEDYGYNVNVMVYQDEWEPPHTGRNIYTETTGIENPEEKYILCAHFDSEMAYCADDNASSVSALLEAARIFSKTTTKNTIIFAFWDSEEWGTHGSRVFVERGNLDSTKITGVINCEMFGWDSNDDALMEIHTRDFAESPQLANIINSLISVYEIGLIPVILNPGSWSSDHGSFWMYGISAVCIGEAFHAGDQNPYYRTEEDRIDKFNLPYFHKLSKLAVASIGYFALGNTLTCVNEPSAQPYTLILEQNYPNPFNASTVIPYQVPIESHVQLNIYNSLGEQVTVLVNERKPAGNYGIRFNGESYPSGLYIYTLSVGGNVLSKKMLLMK
jgi:hypothetical protein